MAPLIAPTHESIYHWSGSPVEFFLPPIVDFCLFWLVLTVLMMVAKGRARGALWCGTVGLTPWVLMKNWAFLTDGKPPHWLSAALFGLGAVSFLTPLAIWRTLGDRAEQAVRVASVVLSLSTASGAAILSVSAWDGWQARSLNEETISHYSHVGQGQKSRPRIIWILLDELSFEQVYGRRFPGLQLPSFDSLAGQATEFTHVIPAGSFTEQVMPVLMTGDDVDAIRSSIDGRLSTHNAATGVWQRFDEHDTVFQDALNLKYSTAVAGWYNPYCRILPNVLDRCFWTFGGPTQSVMLPRATTGENLMMPWMRFLLGRTGYQVVPSFLKASRIEDFYSREHISDYDDLANVTDRILDDRSVGFALIHMPVPHPGGIYNRRSGLFAVKGADYLDNLALADKFLGHVRWKLEHSGQWDESTIVVMGDHSWRTAIWEKTPTWTREEQTASDDDKFDDRPAYLVRLAGQRTGAHIDRPFDAKNTRKLLDGLLAGRIQTKEDLSNWATYVTP